MSGQVYDTAMRQLVEGDPAGMCRVLGLAAEPEPRVLPASFPSLTVAVDLLLRTGPKHLAHVEYQRVGESRFAVRMLLYRALIMRRHPRDRLTQHVVVLGDRSITGHDDLAEHGFQLALGVLYLRDLDPEVFLDDPGLAPLAALAKGDGASRKDALRRAYELIDMTGGERRDDLIDLAGTLATIRLDEPTIRQSLEEANVEETPGRRIMRHVFGEPTRAAVYAEQLRERFGESDDVDAVAERLASWWDTSAASRALIRAGSLEELSKAEEPVAK